MERLKQSIYVLLNNNELFSKLISALIVLNMLAVVLSSYSFWQEKFNLFFDGFELFSVLVFTIEYVLRIWVADVGGALGNKSSLQNRIKFIFSPLGLIDFLAILPFYVPLLIPYDLRFIRILRVVRLLRVLKLGRYSNSLNIVAGVLKETRSELAVTFFVAFILLLFSSTLMYYIEHDAQPDKFADVGSALWWAVATLTTVGYGDVYPVTALGKLLSGAIAVIGIGFVALPTGIISSAFLERINKKNTLQGNDQNLNKRQCPHCGKVIDET